MLSGLTGWMIIAIVLVALILVIGGIVGLVVWLVTRTNKTRSHDLQRAYEAGLQERRQ